VKVLHVNEHLAHKGGVETYLFGALPRLRERGVVPVVAYGDGDPSLHEPARHVPALGTAGFRAEKQARTQMARVLREETPDLVHVHNVQNVGALQASLAYGPTVITTHDYRWVCPANNFFHERPQAVCERTCGRPQYAAYFYRRAKWGIEHADRFARVIAPSSGARAKYEQSGFQDADMAVLPYFCELAPAETPRPLPDPPTITYLGRIAANKGHEYFIEALGKLPSSVQGRMVGSISADVADTLRVLAAEHGCAERLDLHGWASRDEVVDLLDRTSVFVFPSLWPETLGIVGLEALSRGVPVVASDLGGVPEWCREDSTGYRVPPKDGAAIAARVERLLADDDRLRAFGARGISLIKERFRPAQHIDRLLRLYQHAQTSLAPVVRCAWASTSFFPGAALGGTRTGS
jgi:glycosyltransferase involved in cell wall biosynthesis